MLEIIKFKQMANYQYLQLLKIFGYQKFCQIYLLF